MSNNIKPELYLDLTGRLQAAFGIPVLAGRLAGKLDLVPLYEEPEGDSFEDMMIYGNGYDLYFKASKLTKSGILGDVFAPPPIIGYRKAKKLVITDVNGNNGEVVERWNAGVWELTIQGLLVDMENHFFPGDKLEQLTRLFDSPFSFNVAGEWFSRVGIQSLYFLEFMPTGLQGFEDTIAYTLIARSIKPIEFLLNGEL